MKLSKIGKGIRYPERVVQHLAKKPLVFVDQNYNYGTNIFDREWDLLVVLDACRYDLFTEFATRHPVFDQFSSVDRTFSIASQSPDWIQRTFGTLEPHRRSRTTYISDEGHVEMLGDIELRETVSVALSEEHTVGGVIRPDPITEHALERVCSSTPMKYVVHYTQPHAPFLHCVGKYESTAEAEGGTQNVWTGIRDGEFAKSEVWEDYGRNLFLVLDHVETLLANFDGTVVVTADHGNAMGEFGLYGHPGREAAPSIRAVPWAVADASAT